MFRGLLKISSKSSLLTVYAVSGARTPSALTAFLERPIALPSTLSITLRSAFCITTQPQRPPPSAVMSQNNASSQRKRSAHKSVGRDTNKLSRTSDTDAQNEVDAPADVVMGEGIQVLDTPVKSESDKKSYRIIKLPNGLQALLISDPSPIAPKAEAVGAASTDDETTDDDTDSEAEEDDDADDGGQDSDAANKEKLAACSLCIDVGSFSDPRDIQGLAHFLEHMIFMGSAKYPSENEFDHYIKKCGGSDNAHTNCEETQFYFEAGEEHLDGAMDRFASLFKQPLMLKEAMQREREAVEAEFASTRTNDSARRSELLASLGRPNHPSSTFTWGNMLTLRERVPGGDEALYERVHAFRQRHYSAHRMYLCVQARWPLDQLQQLVVHHWQDMASNGLAGDDFSAVGGHREAFGDEFSDRLLLVKPVSNVHRLQLTFCLPQSLHQYRSKPHQFVAYILGHEGEGSLIAYLRQKLFALDLVAGIEEFGQETNSLFTFFTVTIHLTPLGMANVRQVHAATLAYLRFMQRAGPQERLFREMQAIDEVSFRFRTDQPPVENVEEYALNLKYYPAAELFTADALFLDYEPAQIAAVLDDLCAVSTPLNVMLTARQMPDDLAAGELDAVEPWFGTEYKLIAVPEAWAQLRLDAGEFSEFALPGPNQYITSDFTIRYRAGESETVPPFPQRLLQTPSAELWHRLDDRFLLPVAYYNFYLQSPAFRGSAKNFVLAELMPKLLHFRLIERLYPATLAGLGYDIYTSDKGLVVRISGYNQQLPRIVEAIAAALRTFAAELTVDQFRTFVEQKLREYYNAVIRPKSFAKLVRIVAIEHGHVPTLTKFEALRVVTIEDFRTFVAAMLAELRVQALLQGNLTAGEATQIVRTFEQTLHAGPIGDGRSLELRTKRLPSASSHYVRYRNMNASDVNTVTVNYYQLGPISLRLNCLLDLLLMVGDDPCFNELRTKEQLGYDVGYTLRDNNGVLGYSVTIVSQETSHTADHCDRRIEAFRREYMRDHVAALTDAEFGEYHASLVRLKQTDDNHLKDELQRNWAEVTSEDYIFGRQQREVECLRSIGRAEFAAFYAEHCGVEATRKFCVQVIGRSAADDNATAADGEEVATGNGDPDSIFDMTFAQPVLVEFVGPAPAGAVLIHDLDAFSSSLEVYPVCKTADSLE